MNLVWPFTLALISSLILTPIVIVFARRYGLVDDPKKHVHPAILHKKIIPRGGGLAIFLAFLVTTVGTVGVSKKVFYPIS